MPSRSEFKRSLRKLRNRMQDEVEINYLNITSMMDMMTVLLVFMLMNFGASQILTIGNRLKLPHSDSLNKVHQQIAVLITPTNILLADESIVPVKNGAVDKSYKQNHDQNAYLITSLKEKAEVKYKRQKKISMINQSNALKFEDDITIIADRNTPYRLLSEVLYSVAQAGFSKYRFIVQQYETPKGSPP